MTRVAQYQLKCVFSGWKLDTGLGLSGPKMKMRLVLCNRFLGIDWFTHINQQMVMATVLEIITRMSYTHIAQTETAPKPAFNRRAVLRPDEIEDGILWRGLSLRKGRKRQTGQRCGQRDEPGDLHDTSSLNALKGTTRRGIHASDIERWCRNCRGLTVAHTARHSSRNRTG